MPETSAPLFVSTIEEIKALPSGSILLERQQTIEPPDAWKVWHFHTQTMLTATGVDEKYFLTEAEDRYVVLGWGAFRVLYTPEVAECP